MTRLLVAFWIYLCLAMPAMANVAAPGIWGSGHGLTLAPLFSSEASAISEVQMRRELIRIDLYRNFAVVKGTYWFYNHGKTAHRIHAGYPVNGSVRATSPREFVKFEDLYHLRVQVEGAAVAAYRLDKHPDTTLMMRSFDLPAAVQESRNWYVWEMDFPAAQEVKVEVWFIVHTPASLTEGYGKREANAFTYILHTGSAWKDSILTGNLLVTLRDGLTTENIRGIHPQQSCAYLGEQLLYRFSNLRPSANDDLLIWYDGINAAPGPLNADSLFRVVEAADTSMLARRDLPLLDKKDFSTPTPNFVWVLLGALLLGVAFLGGMGYLIYRLVRWVVRR